MESNAYHQNPTSFGRADPLRGLDHGDPLVQRDPYRVAGVHVLQLMDGTHRSEPRADLDGASLGRPLLSHPESSELIQTVEEFPEALHLILVAESERRDPEMVLLGKPAACPMPELCPREEGSGVDTDHHASVPRLPIEMVPYFPTARLRG